MITQECRMRVAATVTLYNSEWNVVRNISKFVDQVDKLYVVDNSETADNTLVQTILNISPAVKYISCNGNQGIAFALNTAAQAAIDDKFEYLLMMDDDSEAPEGLVITLCSIISKSQNNNVAIVAAQSDSSVHRDDEQEAVTAITSGSLLNLQAYQATGPFLDDLFIDWVDHEYCFRLANSGYRIVVANQAKLIHRLGVFKEKNLLGIITVRWRSHSPTRLYYKFRNSLYVMNVYRFRLSIYFVLSVLYELLRDVIKSIFMEKEKLLYFRHIKRGIVDAYYERLGKLK